MAEDEETATARYIASDVSTQLMLKTLFEIIATMADDPDKYRSDVRKKLLELADTMPLAPMPATREKKVRGFVKETVGNLLIKPATSHRSSLRMKIPSLLGMRQKKGCKSLDNIDQRAGIYGNFLHKPIPLLLFRRVAGEG